MESPTTQLIYGDGTYNAAGLDSFAKSIGLPGCGTSYSVVSIMGPQSSGKSTLLNHLYKTKFTEMDAHMGRSQTTQGVWLAKATDVEPATLVFDLEGTDGRERGEDDTTFEKQTALFALAVSDIVLINMWCHDIGREQAANKPLLKTVFQVMMTLFTPRRTILLFVIRDLTRTPLDQLERILRDDINKIWLSVPKPAKHAQTALTDFFQVEVAGLPNYEERQELFIEKTKDLRERITGYTQPGGLAGDRRHVIPGTAFPLSSAEIWKVIKENKDLDLPAHKIMVATVRCEEIAIERVAALESDEDWTAIDASAKEGPVPKLGAALNSILSKQLDGYDAEAVFFEEGVRSAKRKLLVSKALAILSPAHQAVIQHYRNQALDDFKKQLESSDTPAPANGEAATTATNDGFAARARRCTEAALATFDAGAEDADLPDSGWDVTKARDKLIRDIGAHMAKVRTDKLAAISTAAEKSLVDSVSAPASSLLEAAAPNTWASVRRLLSVESSKAIDRLGVEVAGFELETKERQAMENRVADAGTAAVRKAAVDASGQVLYHMKDRFISIFSRDADQMPRRWTGKEDVRAITLDARGSALKLLAVVAAVRLGPREKEKEEDGVEAALLTMLNEGQEGSVAAKGGDAGAEAGADAAAGASGPSKALASATWEGVSAEDTLITPTSCRAIFRQLKAESEYTISQALAAQEASKRGHSWLPPPWAIAAMVFLGFNEFMAVLRNPVWILVLGLIYYFGRALWVQLDLEREFANGLNLPALLAVSARFLPTVANILKKLFEEGHANSHTAPARAQPQMAQSSLSSSSNTGEGSLDSASNLRDARSGASPLNVGYTSETVRQRVPTNVAS